MTVCGGEGRGFPVGDGPQGAPAKPGLGRPEAAPTAMRSMAGPAGRMFAFCRVGNPARPRKKGLPKTGQCAILSIDANTEERSC